MKIYLAFLFLLCLRILSYGQVQRNYAQELINLLTNGRNFEAKEFKLQHQDKLPQNDKVLDLLYNMHMSLAFNKTDSTIVYFEEFLSNPNYGRNVAPVVSTYYVRLYEAYEGKQQFEKAISTVDRHINYLKENPYSLDPEFIKREIGEAQIKILLIKEKLGNEPIRRMVRDKSDTQIKLKDNAFIQFDAQYNGHIIETFFDTGVTEFCVMEKKLADEIGVKYKLKQERVHTLKGKPIKAIEGYIDYIELQAVKLFNIPVLVLIDKFDSHLPNNINPEFKQDLQNSRLKSKQVFLGLPAMKMIGRFEFDWKSNTLTIPQAKEQKPSIKSLDPNIMFIKNVAYLNMKINETDFIGFLDFGADHYLFLTYPYFFKSNCDYVRYDQKKQSYNRTRLLGVQEYLVRYRVENPKIYFGGRQIDGTRSHREAYTVANIDNFDGEVGVSFFKNTFSKTVIDFNTMKIECED